MTPDDVKTRLREAADVLRRYRISIGPKGYPKQCWPDVVIDHWDAYGWTDAVAHDEAPQGRELDQMDEALSWLTLVHGRDRKVLWMWANKCPQWQVAQRYGKSEGAVRHWVNQIVDVIADKVNRKAA